MTIRRARGLALAGLLLQLPLPALAQNGEDKVVFERTGYRFTSLGERKAVSARVLNAQRRPVPNRPIAYRSSDPTIAMVTPQGMVQSRRVGQTRVWAVSGTDSTSALIIVDQWAAKFAFTPSPMTFDAIGSELALDVQLRDASGNVIPGAARRTTQCRPRDGDRVVQLAATGKVRSRTNGVTWIKCSDRGVSDSVRVEVRQRPARAIIVDKLAIGTKEIPDTFRLRMRAFDSRDSVIANVRATWASLNTNMVIIDPVSGLARAVGPGTARIVTQVADATDTLAVTITGTAIAGLGDVASAVDLSARVPTLEMDAIAPIVGDTARITLRATDAAGASISNPEQYIAITSTNDSVIKYVGRQRVLAVSSGTAFIIARFGYSGVTVVESLSVTPRSRSSSSTATVAATAGKEREFKRPEKNVDSARVYNADQVRRLMKAIVDSGIGKTTSGRTVSGEAIASLAKHATRLSPTVSESRSGLLFGGTVVGTPLRKVSLSGTFKTGNLAVSEGSGEDMHVTEVDGQLTLWPVHWFGVGGGYMLRGESTELAVVRWQAANVTTQLRVPFVGDAVTTVLGVSMFPYSKFSGDSLAPEILSSLAGEAGVDMRFGGFVAGFRYYIESFVFPAPAGTTDQRKDQFSTLRLRVGFKLGR